MRFDPMVDQAMLKWPNVPECCGWLSLDARGQWRLDSQVVRHPGIVAFFGRNYANDARGRWFVQNGPQRAYVTLERAPWCLHFNPDLKHITTHNSRPITTLTELILTEQGDVYLSTEHGLGMVCDRDLETFISSINREAAVLADFLESAAVATPRSVRWQGHRLNLSRLADDALERTFNFTRTPSL